MTLALATPDTPWYLNSALWTGFIARQLHHGRWHYSSIGQGFGAPDQKAIDHLRKLAEAYEKRQNRLREAFVRDVVARDLEYREMNPESHGFERMDWIAEDLSRPDRPVTKYDVQDALEEAERMLALD